MARDGFSWASTTNRARSSSWWWVTLGSSPRHKLCSYLAVGTKADFPECRIRLLSFRRLGPLKVNSNNNCHFPEVLNILCSFLSINTWDKLRKAKGMLRTHRLQGAVSVAGWESLKWILSSYLSTTNTPLNAESRAWANGKIKCHSCCRGQAALTRQPSKYAMWYLPRGPEEGYPCKNPACGSF